MKRFWFLFDSLTTRVKLIALLLIVIVPCSGLLVYSTIEHHRLLQANAESQTQRLAEAVAAHQKVIVAHTYQLLRTLAHHPSVKSRDWKACGTMITEFWNHFQGAYSNFHVADLEGNVRCSGMYLPKPVNVADRVDFQDALRVKRFVVGDLVRSRTTNLLSVVMRMPVLDTQGNVIAVVSAQISTEQFDIATATLGIPADGELFILDRGGKIILRRPHPRTWIGEAMPDGPLLRALQGKGGVVQAAGIDGVERVYGTARVQAPAESQGKPGETQGADGIMVAIGFPVDNIRGEVNRHLYANVASMLAVIALALALAWFGVDALVLSKVRILIDTVTRLRGGDAGARTGMHYGDDELSHVAQAIDETAAELERMLTLLRDQNVHDPLTELYNRRYLDERLNHELIKAAKASAAGRPIGVVMVDIDHFKKVNDTHGHDGGDVVLKKVANALAQSVRSNDIVCRYGGEEFCIILPGANAEISRGRAEALRQAVAALKDGMPDGAGVTISLGVAVYPTHGASRDALLHAADAALYEAKHNGRNQAVLARAHP